MEEIESKESSQEEIIMLGSVSSEETVSEDATVNEEEITFQESSDVSLESIEISEADAEEQNDEQNETKPDDKISVIFDSLQELSNKVEQMSQLFMQKIAHTTHEEKIVDQMHSELQKYKQDMYAQLVRPILLDIIEVRDSILRMSASFAAKPEGEQNIPLQIFSEYAYLDIQDILEKNNITIYDSKEGDDFIPIKQKAIKKVTTPVEELHGKVAESLSSGYEYLGKPISPEKVVVYVYEKTENEEGDTNNG